MYFTVPSSKKPRHRIISDDEVEISTPHPKATATRSPEPSDDDPSEIEDETPKLTIKERSRDIDAFFDEPAKVKGSNFKPKRGCKICRYASSLIFLILLLQYLLLTPLTQEKGNRQNDCL